MKKTLIGLIIAMFSFGSASADAGVNIGVSGAGAIFGATATETDIGPNVTEKNTESEIMGAGYASVFVEKELGPVFIGIDYVISTLETEEAQRNIRDCGAKADSASCSTGAGYNDKVNKVKVEFEDSKGKKWYMDQAERFNAFNFNKFKGWSCNSGYQGIIIREPDGSIKRSYSCDDEPLGYIYSGFKLFDKPMPCITNSCVSSADSKIPKRKNLV